MNAGSNGRAWISIVTLGVGDIGEATRFYEKLGWVNTPASQSTISFLAGHDIVLGLYGRAELAADAQVEDTPAGFRGVTLACNWPSREAVDAFHARALAAGAADMKPPQEVFWGGYSGYFADLDGHLWEVAHNPFFAMDQHGRLDLFAGQPS